MAHPLEQPQARQNFSGPKNSPWQVQHFCETLRRWCWHRHRLQEFQQARLPKLRWPWLRMRCEWFAPRPHPCSKIHLRSIWRRRCKRKFQLCLCSRGARPLKPMPIARQAKRTWRSSPFRPSHSWLVGPMSRLCQDFQSLSHTTHSIFQKSRAGPWPIQFQPRDIFPQCPSIQPLKFRAGFEFPRWLPC